MGRMTRARAEVQEERLVGSDRLRVLDERQRPVGQVRRQVVALLGQRRLLGGMAVVHEVGIPLVGLRAEESVEPLEPAADRPLVLGRREVHLVLGRQVPLAGHVCVPPPLAEHLGDRPALERNVTVGAREARCGLGDRSHAVCGVVAAGHQARARRRAQRGRVEVREEQAALGDPVDVRGLDQAAEGLHRRISDVVEHDVEHAWRALRRDRLRVRAPVGHRVRHVDVDYALERLRHEFILCVRS
jgi:hypothetical protein